MKKIILFILLLALAIACVTGCDMLNKDETPSTDNSTEHVHKGGTPTCTSTAVCSECGENYGDKKAHDYAAASCTAPKTCKNCGATEGTALSHDYAAATCTTPKTCKACGATEGTALTHDYDAATCTAPKTCKACGATEGTALSHDYAAASCTAPKTCKVCGATEGEPEHCYYMTYSYDENGHWVECDTCGHRIKEGEHRGGAPTLTSRAVCEVCEAPYGETLSLGWGIEPVTPSDKQEICLTNPEIMEWYESFDFNTTDTNSYMTGEDIFFPVAPTLKWSVGAKANYYKVYVADNDTFIGAVCYLTSDCEVTVEHLYTGEVYYWFVDAVYDNYTVRSAIFSFSTANTPRTVYVDGVSNMRDIGGYITLDGLRIKQGMIYRSAKLDNISELGKYTLVHILGVKTDLDLRGESNATKPVSELNHVISACPWYSSGDNHIWKDDYNKAEFAKAIKVFADPDNYPIVFHCSLGRDRTGTLAMVLGGLLGLDENTLMMEYELSAFSYWGAYGGNYVSLGKNIHDTYLYIDNNYEGNTFSEKVASFLIEIGVTREEIASIKSIMLEEVE